MFEELKKVLERLNGQSVSIPIESDENGYIDKQCPSEDCEFIFKVKKEDWLNISDLPPITLPSDSEKSPFKNHVACLSFCA